MADEEKVEEGTETATTSAAADEAAKNVEAEEKSDTETAAE